MTSTMLWNSRAACIGAAPELFDPPGLSGRDEYRQGLDRAKKICADCPVRQQCLDTAVTDKLSGVWGGVLLERGVAYDRELAELSPHGTPAAYARHLRDRTPPCADCKRAHANEAVERRGGPQRDLFPCGTPAAYQRHYRNGTRPCAACRAAEARRAADRTASA